jgi:hypothetical protein
MRRGRDATCAATEERQGSKEEQFCQKNKQTTRLLFSSAALVPELVAVQVPDELPLSHGEVAIDEPGDLVAEDCEALDRDAVLGPVRSNIFAHCRTKQSREATEEKRKEKMERNATSGSAVERSTPSHGGAAHRRRYVLLHPYEFMKGIESGPVQEIFSISCCSFALLTMVLLCVLPCLPPTCIRLKASHWLAVSAVRANRLTFSLRPACAQQHSSRTGRSEEIEKRESGQFQNHSVACFPLRPLR